MLLYYYLLSIVKCAFNALTISLIFFFNIIISIILDIEYTIITIPTADVITDALVSGLIINNTPHINDTIDKSNDNTQGVSS